MSRPKNDTVDYFPHIAQHGKTLFILEERYGNDGYAFWFKLLELIAQTDGHALYLDDESVWMYFCAKVRITDELSLDILDTLSKLNAIDSELWEHKIVWIQKFVDGVADVYRKNRQREPPKRPEVSHTENPTKGGITRPENHTQEGVLPHGEPQSKVKQSKVKESILTSSPGGEDSIIPPDMIPDRYHVVRDILETEFGIPLRLSHLVILDDLFKKNYPSTVYAQLRKIKVHADAFEQDPPTDPIGYIHSYMKNWTKRTTATDAEKREEINGTKVRKRKCPKCGHVESNTSALCHKCGYEGDGWEIVA